MSVSGLPLLENISLAPFTTWHIGGPAQYFFKPTSIEQLQIVIRALPLDMPKLFLGLGSNVLIRDGGVKGLVIYTRGLVEHRMESDGLYAEVGIASAKIAKLFAKAQWLGGSFLAGIPGSLGGALVMNAGAFGGETWSLVQKVLVLEDDGSLSIRDATDFQAGYRSIVGPKGLGFVGAWLKGIVGESKQAEREMADCLLRRKQTQPIGTLNAGSVFKNPPGDYAARLIEASGLKGSWQGDAQISEKHANFIVNHGRAKSEDVECLVRRVQETVQARFGVQLETEFKILGEPLCNSCQ